MRVQAEESSIMNGTMDDSFCLFVCLSVCLIFWTRLILSKQLQHSKDKIRKNIFTPENYPRNELPLMTNTFILCSQSMNCGSILSEAGCWCLSLFRLQLWQKKAQRRFFNLFWLLFCIDQNTLWIFQLLNHSIYPGRSSCISTIWS